MKTIKATEAARRFSEVLNRVRYQGQSFEIRRGREVVALLVPAKAPRSLKVSELAELFARAPRLAPKERAAFRKDLRAIRKRVPPPENPWD